MKNPYLIQRLKKPVDYINPYSFGGGLVNGGINKEAIDIIKEVMSFDYMGAAEFEWGAVPYALEILNKAEKLATFSIDDKIWGICLPDNKEEVIKWVENASKGNHGHLKERLGFKEALAKEKYADIVGWLKIENSNYCEEPFMFFIDKQMYEDVLNLFRIK